MCRNDVLNRRGAGEVFAAASSVAARCRYIPANAQAGIHRIKLIHRPAASLPSKYCRERYAFRTFQIIQIDGVGAIDAWRDRRRPAVLVPVKVSVYVPASAPGRSG